MDLSLTRKYLELASERKLAEYYCILHMIWKLIKSYRDFLLPTHATSVVVTVLKVSAFQFNAASSALCAYIFKYIRVCFRMCVYVCLYGFLCHLALYMQTSSSMYINDLSLSLRSQCFLSGSCDFGHCRDAFPAGAFIWLLPCHASFPLHVTAMLSCQIISSLQGCDMRSPLSRAR